MGAILSQANLVFATLANRRCAAYRRGVILTLVTIGSSRSRILSGRARRRVRDSAVFERLVLVGALEHVLADRLGVLGLHHLGERDHALVLERAIDDHRADRVCTADRRLIAEVGVERARDRGIAVAHAAVAAVE